jgi:protein-disulfide isomerase
MKLATALLLTFCILPAPMSSSQANPSTIAASKCMGSVMAPVHLDLYSDFQCPHCRKLYLETMRQVIEDCVKNGKVYMVHHDFPLPGHPYAREAARWADAAGTLNKYEQVTTALFEKQDLWSPTGNIEPIVAGVLSPAELAKVKKLLKDPAVEAAIDKDVAMGQTAQVRSTPTLFVERHQNRIPITTFVSFDILKRLIDEQASK